ncbi:unnamed protein product [Caretta caretta]
MLRGGALAVGAGYFGAPVARLEAGKRLVNKGVSQDTWAEMPRREQVTERLSAREGKHGTRASTADATPERLDQVISEQAALREALASLSQELCKLAKCLEETAGRVEALDAKVVTTQSCVVKHAALMREEGGLETERRLEELENRVRARNIRVIGVPAAVGDTDLIPFLENLVQLTWA